MDIRDISMDTFPAYYSVHKGRAIWEIFNLQKKLLDRYVGVEKLPKYPVDINAPINQVMIKDFIARITEELGEAYESYLWLYNWVLNGRKASIEEATQRVYNFNEELADAIHFMVEALIFTSIQPNNLVEYLTTLGFPNTSPDPPDIYNTPYQSPILYQGVFSDPATIAVPSTYTRLTTGGQLLSPNRKSSMAHHMWNITYFLQLARNSLKNKPWKQSHMLSDRQTYSINMFYAFMELLDFCKSQGLTEENFLAIYWAKNQVNHFRLSSKY